jgi:hypothetical protein
MWKSWEQTPTTMALLAHAVPEIIGDAKLFPTLTAKPQAVFWCLLSSNREGNIHFCATHY